jgi:RNA recognition motif-containing protein
MSKNLYVGNLSFETTADDLIEAFGAYGTVTRAQVISDRDTGRSRGFGFVEMADGAEQAIANLNGTALQGRTLTVNEAKPREDRPRSGDRGHGGSGSRTRGAYGRGF